MRRQRSKELEAEILKYYDGRCVRCHSTYQITIHELQPRSHFGNNSDPFTLDNSVVLCMSCHLWAHGFGLLITTPDLIQCQKEFADAHR